METYEKYLGEAGWSDATRKKADKMVVKLRTQWHDFFDNLKTVNKLLPGHPTLPGTVKAAEKLQKEIGKWTAIDI